MLGVGEPHEDQADGCAARVAEVDVVVRREREGVVGEEVRAADHLEHVATDQRDVVPPARRVPKFQYLFVTFGLKPPLKFQSN